MNWEKLSRLKEREISGMEYPSEKAWFSSFWFSFTPIINTDGGKKLRVLFAKERLISRGEERGEERRCTVHFSTTAFKNGPNSSAFSHNLVKNALNHKTIFPEVKNYSSQGL